MFEGIYEILVEILGESKQGSYDPNIYQWQFNCPFCTDDNDGMPDGKYNLEVNFQKMVFMCWKCAELNHSKGSLGKLIKKFGTSEQYRRYKDEIASIKSIYMYDMDSFSGFTFEHAVETVTTLPKTFKKLILSECKDNRVISYCNQRKIDQQTIDKFNIGYTTWDESDYSMRNRIIVPSYDSFGDLNYYVGRDFTGKSKMKYKNCSADKKAIIFQESKINFNSDIILVEGVFDALRFPNTISMLGKVLTNDTYLYKQLMEKCNARVIIAIDGDTEISETKRIYKLLDKGRLKDKVYFINMKEISKYKDFSEAYENGGKKEMVYLLKNINKFNYIEMCE